MILATDDSGETWSIQRKDTKKDQPLFSIFFQNTHHGVAVGLWSLMLVTDDGGKNWSPVQLAPPPGAAKADRRGAGLLTNLFLDL